MTPGQPQEHAGRHIVRLPGGVVIDDDDRLDVAEIGTVTGHQEDWVARHRWASQAESTTELLAACVTSLDGRPASRELIRRMLVGDRDFLMMQLRRITFGDEVHAVAACPSCEAPMDVTLRIDEIPVTRRPQTAAVYEIRPAGKEGDPITFRLPCGADQEAIAALDPAEGAEALIGRCVVRPAAQALLPGDRAAIAAAMEELAPGVDVELDLTCPDCGSAFADAIDLPSFFLSELRGGVDHLLREVHSLAFYYGWSERDILSMDRERRRAYLRILSDALRQE